MPVARKKTAKGSSAERGPQLPASCATRLGGPALVLRGEAREHLASCQPCGTTPSLALSCGRRLGHVAALSPHDRNIIVVAGGSALDSAALVDGDTHDERVATMAGCGAEELDSRCGSGSGGDEEGGCHRSPHQGLTPCEQQLQGSSGGGGGGGTVPAPARATAAHVPASWRTPFPFMECYHIERGVWFAPAGEVRRSAVLGGGAMRWPTQASAVLQWEGDAPAVPAQPTPVPSKRTDQKAPRPRDTAAAATAAAEVGKGNNSEAATATTEAPSGPPGKTVKRKVSPSTFDRLTYSRPQRNPRKRMQTPPATGEDEAATATAAYQPVGLLTDHADNSALATIPALVSRDCGSKGAETLPRAMPSTLALLPSVKPPAAVLLVGGWDGAARLSTVLTYYTGEIPHDTRDPDVAASYTLPSVAQLPDFPAVSHHTCTNIRGSLYCFGGNTLTGCGNEVRILANARLRRAHVREWEAQARRYQQEMRHCRGSATMPGAGRSLVLGASMLSASHRNEETQQRAVLSSRMPTSTESDGDDEGNSSSRDDEKDGTAGDVARGDDGWSCTRVAWPPAESAPVSPVAAAAEGGGSGEPVVPAPAARSSHAAECLGNRYLVIFGGRQLVLPESASSSAERPGKRGKSTARPTPSMSSSSPAQNGGAAGSKKKKTGKSICAPLVGAWEREAGALPQLSLLSDVAVLDTETHRWVQATVTGGEAPEPRYGAAMCALPTSGSGGATELVMHGGVGEDGRVLGDAWVLTAALGGAAQRAAVVKRNGAAGAAATEVRVAQNSSPQQLVVEADPLTGAPAVYLRWVRVELPGSASGEEAARQGQLLQRSYHRAHHALVATPQREVFLIGGSGLPETGDATAQHATAPSTTNGSQHHTSLPGNFPAYSPHHPGSECTPPPPPPPPSGEVCLHSFVVPPLTKLVERPLVQQQQQQAVHEGRSPSRGK